MVGGGGEWGGAYSFVACLSRLSIGHASFSRDGALFLLVNGDTSNILGARYDSSAYLVFFFRFFSKMQSPFPLQPPVATMSPRRMAIVIQGTHLVFPMVWEIMLSEDVL